MSEISLGELEGERLGELVTVGARETLGELVTVGAIGAGKTRRSKAGITSRRKINVDLTDH